MNGTRIFCKGGNWVPTDSLYLRAGFDVQARVREGRGGAFHDVPHMGRQRYEPECFYEYCSEYGILLMHDFMYACGFYPDHLDSFLFEAGARPSTRRSASRTTLHGGVDRQQRDRRVLQRRFRRRSRRTASTAGGRFSIISSRAPCTATARRCRICLPRRTSASGHLTEEGDVHAWSYFGRDPKTTFKFVYELEAFDRMPRALLERIRLLRRADEEHRAPLPRRRGMRALTVKSGSTTASSSASAATSTARSTATSPISRSSTAGLPIVQRHHAGACSTRS